MLGRNPIAICVNFILMVSFLWLYGLFSGASPSVIRAAAMFSLVLFARNILREASLFNTLASSAFLLLCFDPFWLWDVGFQLSYASLIAWYFRRSSAKSITIHNKILHSIWNAISVSLAAQVFTTPLSIFYFHQFPVYFLFANLLAVPLSSGILVGGILLCIFYPFRPFADFLGWLLEIGVQALNGIILYFSKLPEAVIGGLVLNLPQLITMYFIIFCFYRYLRDKQGAWLIAGLVRYVIFQASHFLR
jgi:competence protein ComEC